MSYTIAVHSTIPPFADGTASVVTGATMESHPVPGMDSRNWGGPIVLKFSLLCHHQPPCLAQGKVKVGPLQNR